MTTPITCPHCSSSDTTFKAKAQLWECNECEKRFEDPATQKVAPQTIFLSYAHKSEKEEDYDISEDLVWLIKEELAKDGHEVWIDHEGIRGGTQWRERITDAITSHKHFLAFLSKRSVRHEPNVCLNEVAIAIKHNRIIQTILTEPENQVSAPLTLSSIQWHKFSDWKDIKEGNKTGPKGEDWDAWFGSLMAGIRQNLADITYQKAVGELSELKEILKPTSFDAAIINSVEGFFGRQWLFDATDDWFNTDNRLFWLKGTPGIGKSSFAAKLVHSGNSSIVGFFKCDFQGLKSAEESASECIRTLAYQLASRLPDYRIKLLRGQQVDAETVQKKTADDLFAYLITEPLNRSEKIAEATRLALVIDALDEVGRQVAGKMANPLADLLYKHADQLPPWLGVIVTSRPEAYLQQQLGAKFSPMIMEGGTQNNIQDIKDYLETKLDSSITGEQREKTIAAIIDKSGGTFLFIKRVESSYDLSKPETLPNGLDDLFYKDFERYFQDPRAYEEKTEKFLRLLAAAPGPLPKQMAQDLLQWQARDITQYVTQPMASLLTEAEEGLQFFHKSIKDWLQDGSRSGIYQVNDTGAKELGKFLWSEFEKNQPKEEAKEDEEKESTEPTGTKNKPKRTPSSWEKQIIEWLASLLPNIEQWNNREPLLFFAKYLQSRLKYSLKVAMLERHLELTQIQFGENSNETATSLNYLAITMDDLGRYQEAELLYRRALEIRKEILPPGSLDTADILNNLGLVLNYLGRYQEGEQMYLEALESYEKNLEPQDSKIATILANLGLLLGNLGRYGDAEPFYRRSIELIEQSQGLQSQSLAIKLNSFGLLLTELGRYEEAEPLLNRALSISEYQYGLEHPRTADSYQNLGLLLYKLNRFEEAEVSWRKSLFINQKVLGDSHPATADLYNNLGLLMDHSNRYEEAEPLYKKSFDIYKKFFNPDHPKISVSMSNLGLLMFNLGRYDEAEQYYLKALEISEKILDPSHAQIARIQNNLGCLLNHLDRYDEAEIFFRKALEIREKTFGEKSLMVANITYELGNTLKFQGKISDAKDFYLRGAKIALLEEGENSCLLKYFYRALGVMLRNNDILNEAEIYLEKALGIVKNNESLMKEEAIPELYGLGVLRLLQARYEEAENLLLRCLQIEESIADQNDIDATKEQLFDLYQAWGKPEEAAKYKVDG